MADILHPEPAMATILVPLLVCLAGALVYALSANGKVSELGRIAYFCGLLWLVYEFSSHVIRF